MSVKKPSQYTQSEVNVWLNAIGLGSKIPAFQENAVDGALLVTLTPEELCGDLGLTQMDIDKFNQALQFSTSIAAGGGEGGQGYNDARLFALEQENAQLKAEILDLREIVKVLQEPPSGRQGTGATTAPVATTSTPSYVQSPYAAVPYTAAGTTTTYQSASTYDPYAAYQTQAPAPAPVPSQSYGYSTPAAPAANSGYAPPPPTYAPVPAPAPAQSQAQSSPYPPSHQPAGAPVLRGAAGGAAVSPNKHDEMKPKIRPFRIVCLL